MTSGKAPDFDLPSLTGEPAKLSELLASGPVLLVFFKITCPTCQLTFPFLERLHQGVVGNKGALRVIAISQDDAAATTSFNQTYGVTFTTLLDDPRGYPVSNAYKITNVPTLYLVEPDGSISISAAAFDKGVMEMLGERFGVKIFTSTDRVPVFRPG